MSKKPISDFAFTLCEKLLGKTADGKDYVETIPKRGYRFTAETSEKSIEIIEETPPKVVEKPQTTKRFWVIGVVAVLLFGVLIAAFAWQRNKTQTPQNALGAGQIAVLPFETVGEKEQTLQIGLTDSMITNLSKIKQLKILPMSSVRKFAGQNFDALQVGKQLQADAVLTGNYRFDGENLRVTATLLRVSDNTKIWTETFTAKGKSDLEFENAAALRTARLLSLKIAYAEDEQNLTNQKINPEAAQSYLLAQRIWRSEEFFRRKEMLELFEKTIAIEPNWTQAHAGYAETFLIADLPSVEWEKAEQTANKAIELDASLAQPRAVLGEIYQWRDWNWDKAESEFKQSISLNPNYAEARYKYAQFLRIKRRFAEATEEIKKAIELEPFSPYNYATLCEIYFSDRKLNQAIESCKFSQQLDPNLDLSKKMLFWVYVEKKMYPEIADLYISQLSTEQKTQSVLAKALDQKDLRIYWQDSIDKMLSRTDKQVNLTSLAMHYLLIGEKEKCLNTLEQAYDSQFKPLPRVNAEPMFDSIRNDKRFVEIMRKIGLQK